MSDISVSVSDQFSIEILNYPLSDTDGVVAGKYVSIIHVTTTSEVVDDSVTRIFVTNAVSSFFGSAQLHVVPYSCGIYYEDSDTYSVGTVYSVGDDASELPDGIYNLTSPLTTNIAADDNVITDSTARLGVVKNHTIIKDTDFSFSRVGYGDSYNRCNIFNPMVVYTDNEGNILGTGTITTSYPYYVNAQGEFLRPLLSDHVIMSSDKLPQTPTSYTMYTGSDSVTFQISQKWESATSLYQLAGYIYQNFTPSDTANPYSPDDSSETGGGDGSGTPADDDVQPDDGIPSISVTETGLISLYSPTISELKAFGNYLWSDAFSLDTFKKLFSDPMDAIIGMSVVPLALEGNSSSLIIGNVDTGVSASRLPQQYYSIDCGSFTVLPDINSYLDYSPYTRFTIFLPYIGFQTLDSDDIMNQTLNVKYKVDVLTTALICEIRVNDHLRYSFSGTCGTSIPITAQSWSSMIQSVVSSAASIAGLAVGAAAAPVTGGTSLGLSAMGAAGSIAGNALSMKPDIQKGGNLGSAPGFMGWQKPFLIRYTPRRVNSKRQQTYTGYPSLITSALSDVHGYTEIQSINLAISGATDSECSAIERQLKEGVILP